ncbi:hypothetical protein ACH5RR_038352 [Cinchona calisaya]|uniref:DUF7722 domain-containing protein n=1 Tax=Cinchona calisaya TaxID=153742 RepID=A0ABD2XV12_9GENT
MTNHFSMESKNKQQKTNKIAEMPLHYPRFNKADYEKMPEAQLDCLLNEYGLPVNIGDIIEKRKFAMGAFLWPDQY